METLRRFRLWAVRLSLFVTVVSGGVAFVFSPPLAKGIFLGGATGTLAFWLTAFRLERLAITGQGRVKSFNYRWALIRLVMYVLALLKGYTLDREHYHGLIGAVAGLFIIRAVSGFLGATGVDLKKDEN